MLRLCEEILASGVKGESERARAEQEYWVRATIVEALFGLGRVDESNAAFDAAKNITPTPEAWMVLSTNDQLEKIKTLLATAGGA